MDVLLPVLIAAAALACPAHMLWQRWRGKTASCLPAARSDAAALRARQEELAREIAALEAAEPAREAVPIDRAA